MNMGERYFALTIGILFLLLGFSGFIPNLMTMSSANASNDLVVASPGLYSTGFGYVFGLFPTNIVHNIVHLAVGFLGIASFMSVTGARVFNRAFAISYILLAIMGLLPYTRTTFGLMPIFGNNVWFNGVAGLIAAYYGFVKPTTEPEMSSSQNI